ncbi:M56 family metallopeptidase [Flavivirga amylovorans]|uniref:M56 family metallopeptidase n=1 Tax=Flavivirga amylovorans TaxID=870486 RepID=A0ABT8X659_9FLAO|nr:M56 family metallopeptidase [Flavivirga amylovorans]MDO5989476.1 M56 family metallopeptidase [Flavivirga amylovorans]
MEYLLKVSAVITIFYIVYKAFLQRDTFFESNRVFLLSGLISSFIIPFLVIPIYIEQVPTFISNYNFGDTPVENVKKAFNILDYLPTVYLVGLLIFSIRFIIQLASLYVLILKDKNVKHGDFRFVKVNTNVSPFSFFNWIVYNPNQFNKTELDQIIAHEKVHVKQYHSIDILFAQLSCIALWFNPFVWLYNKDLRQNLEFLADNSAINKTKSKKDYQYTLLKTSMPSHQMALSNNFYNSLIKKRIVMLHKSKSKKINQFKFAIVIPILTLFLMSFNTKEVYINKAKISEDTLSNDVIKIAIAKKDTETIVITKDFTDTNLDNLISKLKKKDITIKFKGVKRNSSGEIIAIKINVETKHSNANYNINSNAPIKPIKITFDKKRENISIGNVSKNQKYVVYNKKGKPKTHKSHDNDEIEIEHEIEIVDEDEVEHETEHEVETEQIVEENKIILSHDALKNKTKTTNKMAIYNSEGKSPIYIVNGKEVKKLDFEELDHDDIKNINVIKGDVAIEKYGEKGKNGVIKIITKKE